MSLKRMRVSRLIKELTELQNSNSDLFVYYIDSYDRATPIFCASVEDRETGWNGAPNESAIYLS